MFGSFLCGLNFTIDWRLYACLFLPTVEGVLFTEVGIHVVLALVLLTPIVVKYDTFSIFQQL